MVFFTSHFFGFEFSGFWALEKSSISVRIHENSVKFSVFVHCLIKSSLLVDFHGASDGSVGYGTHYEYSTKGRVDNEDLSGPGSLRISESFDYTSDVSKYGIDKGDPALCV